MFKKPALYASAFAFVLLASAAYAQYAPTPMPTPTPAAITRQILQTANFPGDQYQTVQAYVVIAPGATVGSHTHPGVELGYVIDGQLDLYVQGQAPRHVKAGDSFMNPADTAHWAKNSDSNKPAKILSVYVVDKSKPLASAAASF